MYRQWIKWIIVGFAAVPPHAIAEEAAGLASIEAGSATTQVLGESNLIFVSPNVAGITALSATALLAVGTTVYLLARPEVKALFREARDQAIRSAAAGDKTPITSAGKESSLAMAVEIEKQTAAREHVALPQLTELEWAAIVVKHAAEVEVL